MKIGTMNETYLFHTHSLAFFHSSIHFTIFPYRMHVLIYASKNHYKIFPFSIFALHGPSH